MGGFCAGIAGEGIGGVGGVVVTDSKGRVDALLSSTSGVDVVLASVAWPRLDCDGVAIDSVFADDRGRLNTLRAWLDRGSDGSLGDVCGEARLGYAGAGGTMAVRECSLISALLTVGIERQLPPPCSVASLPRSRHERLKSGRFSSGGVRLPSSLRLAFQSDSGIRTRPFRSRARLRLRTQQHKPPTNSESTIPPPAMAIHLTFEEKKLATLISL